MAQGLDRWGRMTTCTDPVAGERTQRPPRRKSKARVREVHELRPDLLDPVVPALRDLLWNLVVLAARPLLWLLDSRAVREHRRRLRH